jgi:hypothetical protein
MAFKQFLAVFGALAFLGAFLLVLASGAAFLAVEILGEERLLRWFAGFTRWLFGGWGFARKILFALALLLVGYGATLVGASTVSRNYDLAPGQEKYFCETDCHIAYSVVGVQKTKSLGSPAAPENAAGMFYVITLRTRFDEHTISAHRGDSPLTPSPRAVSLVDHQGHEYLLSSAGQQALEDSLDGRWTPLTQPLRPGESYVTQLVFDVPASARGLKLLVASPTRPGWVGRIIIGDEGSLWHKKVYLQVPGN